MINVLILTVLLFQVVQSQVIVEGTCPDVKVVQNFDAKSYLGTWYENARYFTIFEVGTKCISATYSLNDNGTVKVLNRAVSLKTGAEQSIEGHAELLGNGTEGRLLVKFPTSPMAAEYLILGTDYDNWAAVFSCKGINIASAQFAWLLTRERIPSEEVLSSARNAFTSQGIKTDILSKTDQENCSKI